MPSLKWAAETRALHIREHSSSLVYSQQCESYHTLTLKMASWGFCGLVSQIHKKLETTDCLDQPDPEWTGHLSAPAKHFKWHRAWISAMKEPCDLGVSFQTAARRSSFSIRLPSCVGKLSVISDAKNVIYLYKCSFNFKIMLIKEGVCQW